jgi:hypothetical protein
MLTFLRVIEFISVVVGALVVLAFVFGRWR